MFDTVGFYIEIDQEMYNELLNKGIVTQRIDKDNGFVEFEYTNFKTHHSYNYRVQWKVDNKHFVYDNDLKITREIDGAPFLRLEFSVPKIINGNNLESHDVDSLITACTLVAEMFEKNVGVTIPGPGDWFIYRCDVCANYLLQDIKQVKSYIRYLQRLDYPRRVGNAYKDTGLYFASRHNTLKVYCKGDEFRKHDAIRFADETLRKRLQKEADKVLRIEVELKRRIKYLVEKHEKEYNEKFKKFKGCVSLEDFLYICDVKQELKNVMKKFLCGQNSRVMKCLDVFTLLNQTLPVRTARNYYAIYMLLITQGQREVKRQIPIRTYYKALKIFRDNQISIIASDIEKDDNFQEVTEQTMFLDYGFPEDFSLEIIHTNKYYQLPLAA